MGIDWDSGGEGAEEAVHGLGADPWQDEAEVFAGRIALHLTLNCKSARAYNRTRDGDFDLDGLKRFDLVDRTVAVIGTGRIGTIFGQIMAGFGCSVIAYDVHRSPEFERFGRYVGADEISAEADVISLYVLLTLQTHTMSMLAG